MSDFQDIKNSDPQVAERMTAATEKLIELAKSALNVELDAMDIEACPEARIHAVSGVDIDLDRALEEMKALDRTKGLLAEQQRAAAIRAGDNDELAALARLPRHERMATARRLGVDDLNKKLDPTSVSDRNLLLKQCLSLSPQQRINFARRHGLMP
ncbi:hypothetical protein [Citreimonas salinaria]|uniref:Uncharacterized protein n=1 Tax=Citreimonas salinaria TaxID=321339 RepID=A0A1H3LL45_9RHOB|nr:hypothetical protein [Citreimonas salinaria]SDY65066.1 hypothetical protein SAMN05444340_11374 [Citreimonas salinaria]